MNILKRALFLILFLFFKSFHTETPFETFKLYSQCYGSPPTQSCYLIYNGSYSWFGAHARCHSQGLSLALGSPTAQFTTSLLDTWFYNAHRVWYNMNGPAYADGTLLSASQRVPVDTSGEGDCFKFSRNELTRVNCKQVLTEVHFGCELREGIDYLANSTTLSSCPSDWRPQEYRTIRLPFCTLQNASQDRTTWDTAQAQCISRGGRLFSVRNDLDALWLEQFVRSIPRIRTINDVFVDLHELLYCIDGWCWANGRRNVSSIIPWIAGEPNSPGTEECAHYYTSALNEAEQRGVRACIHTGLNNLACSSNGGNVQVVLCRLELNPITAQTFTNMTTTTRWPPPLTCSNKCPSQLKLFSDSSSFLSAFHATMGWALFSVAVIYIVVLKWPAWRARIQKIKSNGVENERTNETGVLSLRELSLRAEERTRNLLNTTRVGEVTTVQSGEGSDVTSTLLLSDSSIPIPRLSLPTPTFSLRPVSTFSPPANHQSPHLTSLTAPTGNTGGGGEHTSQHRSLPPLPFLPAAGVEIKEYGTSGALENKHRPLPPLPVPAATEDVEDVYGNSSALNNKHRPIPPLPTPSATDGGEEEYGNSAALDYRPDNSEQEYCNVTVGEALPEHQDSGREPQLDENDYDVEHVYSAVQQLN